MQFSKGGTTVTFEGALYPLGYESARHQTAGISEDGTVRVYDGGVLEEYITLEIKDGHDNLTNIRNFINNTVKMRMEAFTFTPDPGMNVGNGDGGAVTVRYWASSFAEKQESYHKYRYTMTLRREIS